MFPWIRRFINPCINCIFSWMFVSKSQIWFWDVSLLFCEYFWELFGSILKLRGALGDLFGSILTILSPGGSLGDHFGLFERPGWLLGWLWRHFWASCGTWGALWGHSGVILISFWAPFWDQIGSKFVQNGFRAPFFNCPWFLCQKITNSDVFHTRRHPILCGKT